MRGDCIACDALFIFFLRGGEGKGGSASVSEFVLQRIQIYKKKRKEKRKYVARPGIEPRTPDLRVRCPTDCQGERREITYTKVSYVHVIKILFLIYNQKYEIYGCKSILQMCIEFSSIVIDNLNLKAPLSFQ